MIYFDTAATSLQKPAEVAEAVARGLACFGNASRSAYGPSLDAARAVYSARKAVGGLFGAPPLSVAFTSGATESLNAVINSIAKPGGHVITTELEHNSVLRPLYRSGAGLGFVKYRERSDIRAYKRELRPNTAAVVAAHASNLTGDALPIAEIGKFCKDNGLIFVLDAAQTAGAFTDGFAAAGVDILCFAGHKGLMGPMGTGGVCLYRDIALTPFKAGGSGSATFDKSHPSGMPSLFEAGTLNAPAIAGLSAGVEFIKKIGAENIRRHETALAEAFLEGISGLPGITVYGDFSGPGTRAAVIAFNIGETDSGEAAARLWNEYGIACRGGFHCAPLMHMALGTQRQGAVRASFGWFNTVGEVGELVRAVREVSGKGRR